VVGKMKISFLIKCFFLFAFCLVLLSNSCLAEAIDLEVADDTGDVENQNIDITYASVTQDETFYQFHMQVQGEFVSNELREYRYVFKINGLEKVWYTNDLAYLYDPFLECNYTLDKDKLTIEVPIEALEDLETPWEVIATASIYEDSITDQALLKEISNTSEETANETPGFEFVLLLSIISAFVLLKRKSKIKL
jgi:hypothetical protein